MTRICVRGHWLLVWAILFLGGANAADEPTTAKLSPTQLRLEVMALRTLHQLQFSPEQRQALRKLAGAGSAALPEADKLSDAVLKNLQQLHGAFLKGAEDRISELEEDLDALLEQEKRTWEVDVKISAGARREVAAVRRLLSARQVAAFLSLYDDDLPDPLAAMMHALDHAPLVKPDEWKAFSDNTGELVGRLVAGLDDGKIRQVATQVSQWLKQAKGLGQKEVEKRRPTMESEACRIVAGTDPIDVLRNIVDHTLAELLSNPRLTAALEAMGGQ
jgi:hypothetical protein